MSSVEHSQNINEEKDIDEEIEEEYNIWRKNTPFL